MITIRDFMEVIDYRITEGSEYLWTSFGSNAYQLDSWDGRHDDGTSVGIVFDTQTQTVYQMEAHDYSNRRSYRWTHPDHVSTYRAECVQHLAEDVRDMAYDDVKYIDLEVSQDMINKARAIVRHENYDHRVSVPIDLEDHELFKLMTLAHERDLTLNQLVEEILWTVIRKEQSQVDSDSK